MDFAFSADQEELRAAARRLLADRLPAAQIHELADATVEHDPALWAELVSLGWIGLSSPDGGGTFLDEAVLLEEAGYALAPTPLLAAVVALPAGAPNPTVTTVFAQGGRAKQSATGWQLDERIADLPDLGAATQIVVSAEASDSSRLFVVEATDAVIRMLPTVDGTRRIGELSLVACPAKLLAEGPAVAPIVVAVKRRQATALALESVGIATRMLEMAAEHAKTRQQFGRAIGSYQGVSHRIADVFVRTELARSLAYRAAWCVAISETEPGTITDSEIDVACAGAKATATEAAVFAAESAIQVLGGIGMTWEHLAHRYYKRALGNESSGGTPAEHRATVANALLGAVR